MSGTAGRLRIEYMRLGELQGWPGNPKRHDEAGIGASMRAHSYTDPVMIDETSGRMVRGHGRRDVLLAFQAAGEPPPVHVELDGDGEWLVPVLRGVAFESVEQAENYVVADNQLTIVGGWDEQRLAPILQRIMDNSRSSLVSIGFTSATAQAVIDRALAGDGGGGGPQGQGNLAARFIVPPFSVLDARQGYWQERKRAWLALGIRSELGRGEAYVPVRSARVSDQGRVGAGGLSDQLVDGKQQKVKAGRQAGRQADSNNYARVFGQDLMRGEHRVGRTGSTSDGRKSDGDAQRPNAEEKKV